MGEKSNVGFFPLRRKDGNVANPGKFPSQTVDKLETKALRIKRNTVVIHFQQPLLEGCDVRVNWCFGVTEKQVESNEFFEVFRYQPQRMEYPFQLVVIFNPPSTVVLCVTFHRGCRITLYR